MKKLLIALIYSGLYSLTYGQCSDSGVCSIGNDHTSNHNNTISLSYGLGMSGKTDDIKFHSFSMATKIFTGKNSYVSAELPFGIQNGPLGNTSGIGDLLLIYSLPVYENESLSIFISGGFKLATSTINSENSLPQSYQNGLGTNDVLLGTTLNVSSFGFSLGYQISGGRNENSITKLKRGDDLLIKGSYMFNLSEVSLKTELLFIQRIGVSSVALLNAPAGTYFEIPDSDQSQLNFLINGEYEISGGIKIFVGFAVPFLNRSVNVDGLTRTFSSSTGISFGI